MVERVGILGDAFQSASEFGLLKEIAWLVEIPIAQKNAFRFRKFRQVIVRFEILRIFVGERETVVGELDGGSHYSFDRQPAVLFLRINQAGDGAGNADGPVSDNARIFAGFRDDIALRVQIHIFCGRGRRFLAEVDETSLALGVAKEHEAAATEIAGLRMDDGERKAGGDCGIDGIASGVQHFDSGTRCEFVHACHDGLRGVRRTQGRRRDPDHQESAQTAESGGMMSNAH